MRILKPKHTVDWFYTESNKFLPKSATQEMLESGGRKITNFRITARKQLDLNSYSGNDFRLELMNFENPKNLRMTTSYKRDYGPPYNIVCPPIQIKQRTPDYLFNRKPVNDFGSKRCNESDSMFMDDHFINITEARRKVNLQRQLSYIIYQMSNKRHGVDWFYMDMTLPTPISTTHELLETGRRERQTIGNRGVRMEVNFQSYDFKDFRLDVGRIKDDEVHKRLNDSILTSYSHDYRAPYPHAISCLPMKPRDDFIDPIFNRKPVNAFKMLPSSPGKFMDDHFAQDTAVRKRKNFFRQLRAAKCYD